MYLMKQKWEQEPVDVLGKVDSHLPWWFRPEIVFTALALSAGLFMVFATAPFQAPDEDNHFMRIFQLSEGQLLPIRVHYDNGRDDVGGVLPACVRGTSEVFMRMKFAPLEKVAPVEWKKMIVQPFAAQPKNFTGFCNTAVYPPISYIPQVVGIWLTRPLVVSPLVMMYAGRLLNLFCWWAIVYAAIRVTPIYKWVMMLVGLLPMGVFLAASLSADPMTNAMVMLLVAVVLKSTFGDTNRLAMKEKLLIAVLCVGVAVAKTVYCPFVALVLLIPASRLGGWKAKLIFCSTTIITATIIIAGWTYLVKDFVVTVEWAEPAEQISFIMHNPVTYMGILIKTVQVNWRPYWGSLVGILGWLDIPLPIWIYYTYAAVFVTAAITDTKGGGEKTLGFIERGLLGVIWLLSFILVETSMYVLCTQPGSPEVVDVQGRYLIPTMPLLLLILHNRWVKMPSKWLGGVATVYCVSVLAVACVAIIERYY